DIFCVDYLHHVSVNQTWNATFSNMGGNLSATYGFARWGDATIAAERYKVAALLSTKFTMSNKTQWGSIHGAIWNLMSDGTAMQGITTVGGNAASQGKLTDAFAELNADPNAVNASEWMVITDASGSTQEFITRNVVPEPETIILLVSGLMAIGAVAYFRGVSA
ncbi:MAG: PEP-CTERM sorting domain-containing protein, partial [Gemmatimonadota bacterium]|nr:PEP-CTERM sorting domain-containing protein [Gemmatimonadota bacterium]